MGCMARYEAKDRARMKVMLAPWDALAMAVKMKRLVRADVERAMHVATVKGLKRKLSRVSSRRATEECCDMPCSNSRAAPCQVFPRRREQACSGRVAALGDVGQCSRTQ